MKTPRVLVAIALLAVAALSAALPARAEEGPREIVTGYMEALKARNYLKIMHYIGLDLPPEVASLITPALEKQTFITWAVKGYTIKEVKQDGGLATVIVEEHHFKSIPPQVRADLAGRAPAMDKLVIWGDNVVTERFVLVRLDGRWQFDAGHSGVQAGPLKDLATQGLSAYARTEKGEAPASTPPVSPEAMQAAVGQFINQVGFGQLVQSLSSSAPALPAMAAFLIPNFVRARSMGQLTACKSNLKNIGTALEMYSTDNAGRFPTALSQLKPSYLMNIPTCPAAGADSYSATFQSACNPDAYTVMCTGAHHREAGMPANFPRYTSTQGLLTE